MDIGALCRERCLIGLLCLDWFLLSRSEIILLTRWYKCRLFRRGFGMRCSCSESSPLEELHAHKWILSQTTEMTEEFQNLYLDYSYRNQNHLLLGDGPLPFSMRHYIALMGAVVRSHSGLAKYNVDQFLYRGGNPLWLSSLDSVPPKLQNLREINEILATEPWLLTPSHISKLLRNPGIWSLAELMHAILILINIHSLSRFSAVYDLLKMEDACGYHLCSPLPENAVSSGSSSESEPSSASPCSLVDCGINRAIFFSRYTEPVDGGKSLTPTNTEVLSYVEDTSMTYHEFRERLTSHKGSCFHFYDYSWQDHGYSLVNRLYMEFGDLLDEEFSVIQNESAALYVSNKADDAAAYTRAVWNYVFQLFGIQLEDYHRNEVNQRLSTELKAFIKLVACFPERLHLSVFSRFLKDVKPAEKRHVNVLVQEALFQVLLLYSLRALCTLT